MVVLTRRANLDSPPSAAYDTPPSSSSSKSGQKTFISSPSAFNGEARPLCPAKTVLGAGPGPSSAANSRRFNVAFSPQIAHTKLFRSEDPPLPNITPARAPLSSTSACDTPSSSRSGSPSVRGILKTTSSAIRLAKSAKEGTWNNREAARLVVAGQKPAPFYSQMVLSELCDNSDDGFAGKAAVEDEVDSDDIPVEPTDYMPIVPPSDASEEEEGIECLHSSSLLGVILEGTEDLLTLEESYISLVNRLRDVAFAVGPFTESTHAKFESVWQPIAEESPAVVRAIQRDLHRLMGRVPNSEANTGTTPFRGLKPGNGLPPSPSKSPKQGYTAAEVLYRREAAGVGSAVLRFLATVFSQPRLFTCFSEADVQSLLDQVLVIMRSPTLPTPFAKRSYYLTLTILSAVNLPPAWIRPFGEKLASALECGLVTIGTEQFQIKDTTSIRKEAFCATANLLRRYPHVMLPYYSTLLPICLRAYYSPSKAFRRCGVGAAATFVSAKLQILEEAGLVEGIDEAEWEKLHSTVTKCEMFVGNFLKTPIRINGKFDYDNNTGERKLEGTKITSVFRATIGEAKDVAWACTALAILASLLGHAYNTFPIGKDLDVVLDRCLQTSTNMVRPTLATISWQHTVHAYLQAGTSVSFNEEGKVIYSYNPFVASCYQDVNARINTILCPVRECLNEAHKSANVTRALVTRPEFNNEQRWSWQRSEKPRRFSWMLTTGMAAPSVIYAYTVVSLLHHDPSAAEMSRLSGILSSDGDVPDSSPEERRLPLLDRVFELVLHPVLKQMLSICGVDKLKTTGWEILAAVTAPTTGCVPSLDRLVSNRYLNAEIIGLDDVSPQVLLRFKRDIIEAHEIPSWGKLWIAKRLGKLLSLFQAAFDGIRGITELGSVDWVMNNDGLVLLPSVLSRVWENLLLALAFANTPDAPTPIYLLGLRAITRTILQVFEKDPASYIPICLLSAEGKSTLDPNAIRLGISSHLYNVAVEVLGGSAMGGMRIDINVPGLDEPALAAESIGHPTVAGYILGHLLSSKHFSDPLDSKVSELFTSFVSALLDSGSSRNLGTKLLGDLTNKIPFIFEGYEKLQLDVWRLLALKWTSVVDLEPSESTSATNHTGGLLTTLLSCPFRNTSLASIWYTDASEEDISAWDTLLKVTVLRFRAKRAGSNLGVMETLAAHLGDFIRIDDDDAASIQRRTCATTLHCLAHALTWIALVPNEHYHADHYRINENYVPTDFLSLVASVLVDVYAANVESESVLPLLQNTQALLCDLPTTAVEEVVQALHPGVAMWMTDANHRVSGVLGDTVDSLYVSLVDSLTRAIECGAIPACSETMETYIELYAPRLSNAQSQSVPAAFQQLWHRAFQPIGKVDYSDDVATFLRDVLTAVPGFIIAEGLETLESSESLFPFANTVPPLPITEPEVAQSQDDDDEDEAQAEMAIDAIDITDDVDMDMADPDVVVPPTTTPEAPEALTEYDAEESGTPTKRRRHRNSEIVPQSSPPGDEDVFGSRTTSRRRRTRRRERSDTSSDGSTPGANDTTFIAETPLHAANTSSRTDESPTITERQSLFSSAQRWLRRRVPSLLPFSTDDTDVSDSSVGSSRTRRKRRRPDSREHSEQSTLVAQAAHHESESSLRVTESAPEISSTSSNRPSRPLRQTASLGNLSTPQPGRSTPRASNSSTPEPVLTRSAARKRDTDDCVPSDSSDRKSKRRRRATRNSSFDDSESPSSLPITPRAKRAADRAAKEERERKEREKEQAEKERLEGERLRALAEANRLKEERMERSRLKKEHMEKARRHERLEQERLENERLEEERLEKERLEKERLEKERLEKERLEEERLTKERLEKERLEQQRLEEDRLKAERLEKERLEQERLAQERLEQERLAQERLQKERLEQERLEEERLEQERLEQEHLERERLERERLEQERLEQERQRKEKEVLERRKARQAEKERNERERAEQERLRQAQENALKLGKTVRKSPRGQGKNRATEPEPETQVRATPEISGRFDDAPGDNTPRATRQSLRTRSGSQTPPKNAESSTAVPATPIRRTVAQKRVLDMVEEALKYERAIASLDMDGVIGLLSNIDRLRDAATANLQAHAIAGREERRRCRRGD